MEELKIASLKLVTGEEIICGLMDMYKEGPYTTVVIKDPVRIERRDRRKRDSYSLSNWLIIGNEGIHDIELSRIITVNLVDNDEILDRYKAFTRKKLTSPKPRGIQEDWIRREY